MPTISRDLLENTDFLQPRSRVNEMAKNFIDPGLRTWVAFPAPKTSLGIPVDFDPKRGLYVLGGRLKQLYHRAGL